MTILSTAISTRLSSTCPLSNTYRPPNSSLSTVNHPINIYIVPPSRQLFWLHLLPAKILYMLSTSTSSSLYCIASMLIRICRLRTLKYTPCSVIHHLVVRYKTRYNFNFFPHFQNQNIDNYFSKAVHNYLKPISTRITHIIMRFILS